MGDRLDVLGGQLDQWQHDATAGGASSSAPNPAAAVSLLEAAEAAIAADPRPLLAVGGDTAPLWKRYLEATGERAFLLALEAKELRYRWAETAFSAICRADYRLGDLLERNIARHPQRTFLQAQLADGTARWSYQQVGRDLRAVATALHGALLDEAPRVALFTENGLAGASCDLACLLHGIFVSPLNVHTDAPTLAWICDTLAINVVVVDVEERYRLLERARDLVKRPFQIVKLAHFGEGGLLLPETTARIGAEEALAVLAAKPRPGLHDVATVLFTSGSTGQPKGVSFTPYHLISKRFARHAALPDVGMPEELLFAYLPLYHTFGRYLELLGMLYWGGTYVFAGNPSAETLRAGMRRERPTGLISIPLRWAQLHEACMARLGDDPTPAAERAAVQTICGDRLRWGLSAAGYLDPKVFRFFQRNGVAICSGFGMTEGTGGITMSPPNDYRDDTVGIPLPGLRLRFGELDELLVGGHYMARYLEDAGPGDTIDPEEDHWLATGDLFQQLGDGHVRIVDRIKDIYKNSKGQTIAPRRVEQKFTSVPGVERTFLVGDGRSHNALLIVPKSGDPLLEDLRQRNELDAYFGRLVAQANRDLAPYERVVAFALLDRDFSEDKGELTAKGSYRRKAIEENFAPQIARLYRSRNVDLDSPTGLRLRLPRWIFRDLGLLETDILAQEPGLVDTRRDLSLRVKAAQAPGWWRIGDLEYQVESNLLDLGVFSRQPWLWLGNPALEAFFPCKEGWDTGLGAIKPRVRLVPPEVRPDWSAADYWPPASIHDHQLLEVDELVQRAYFGEAAEARAAVEALGSKLTETDDRLASLIRRRIAALAEHDDEEVRCDAYRTLLLDQPMPDYAEAFGVFIGSGRTFLNHGSIKAIASADLQPLRLQALRQRLYGYRTRVDLPPSEAIRGQFLLLFQLLVDFVHAHPDYFASVRAELATWALYERDPELAERALQLLDGLNVWYDGQTKPDPVATDPLEWQRRLVFDQSIDAEARARILEALCSPSFFRKSMLLAHDQPNFSLGQVPPEGIWVTQILTSSSYRRYRLSINTRKHFDLQLVLRQIDDDGQKHHLWAQALAGYPFGTPVFPRYGCRRSTPAATTLVYQADLTVWEKTRQYASALEAGGDQPWPKLWRKLFVRAFATVFSAWDASERRVVPGCVSPTNILVPELDYRESAVLLSLTELSPYERPTDLLRPLLQNFFVRTLAHYPWCRSYLDKGWLFEGVLEALGTDRGLLFLGELRTELAETTVLGAWPGIAQELDVYLDRRRQENYVPLPVFSAIEQYLFWRRKNPTATVQSQEDVLLQLFGGYRLDRYPEWSRLHLYRHTFFAEAPDAIKRTFDALLAKMFQQPRTPATQLVELSELQASLDSAEHREVLSRMIFPRTRRPRSLRVQTIGEKDQAQVVVRTDIVDHVGARYTLRNPTEPAEIGRLYGLYHQERYPQPVREKDHYLIVLDSRDEIVGGLCYQLRGGHVAYIDSMVISRPLQRRGIGGALFDELCTRMQERDVKVVKANLLLGDLAAKQGFAHDPRWGGFVRFLSAPGGNGL